MIENILYKEKDIPQYLPRDFRDKAVARLNYLENLQKDPKYLKIIERRKSIEHGITGIDISIGINFVYRLLVDDRMKTVWNDLCNINMKNAIKFFAQLEFYYGNMYNREKKEFLNLSDIKTKIYFAKEAIAKCGHLEKYLNNIFMAYSTDCGYDEYDRNELIGYTEHQSLIDQLKNYKTRLREILFHYESNKDLFESESYLANPVSRKNKIKNVEAILWAKKIKSLLLYFYDRPLDKELGIIISVLFDDGHEYDTDYIKKITEDVRKSFNVVCNIEDS